MDRDARDQMDQQGPHPGGSEGLQEVVKNSKEQIIEFMQRSKLNVS